MWEIYTKLLLTQMKARYSSISSTNFSIMNKVCNNEICV